MKVNSSILSRSLIPIIINQKMNNSYVIYIFSFHFFILLSVVFVSFCNFRCYRSPSWKIDYVQKDNQFSFELIIIDIVDWNIIINNIIIRVHKIIALFRYIIFDGNVWLLLIQAYNFKGFLFIYAWRMRIAYQVFWYNTSWFHQEIGKRIRIVKSWQVCHIKGPHFYPIEKDPSLETVCFDDKFEMLVTDFLHTKGRLYHNGSKYWPRKVFWTWRLFSVVNLTWIYLYMKD